MNLYSESVYNKHKLILPREITSIRNSLSSVRLVHTRSLVHEQEGGNSLDVEPLHQLFTLRALERNGLPRHRTVVLLELRFRVVAAAEHDLEFLPLLLAVHVDFAQLRSKHSARRAPVSTSTLLINDTLTRSKGPRPFQSIRKQTQFHPSRGDCHQRVHRN